MLNAIYDYKTVGDETNIYSDGKLLHKIKDKKEYMFKRACLKIVCDKLEIPYAPEVNLRFKNSTYCIFDGNLENGFIEGCTDVWTVNQDSDGLTSVLLQVYFLINKEIEIPTLTIKGKTVGSNTLAELFALEMVDAEKWLRRQISPKPKKKSILGEFVN